MKKQAILVDVDRTLANIDHRVHHLDPEQNNGKKNWKAFFAGTPYDTPNDWCVDIVSRYYGSDVKVLLVSARGEETRAATEEWLLRHNIDVDDLIMRKEKDYREDPIIKEEMYREHIEPHYDVMFVIDDRPRVCRMWRDIGLTVLQCADLEF
jgi:hypothetical protein